MDYRKQQRLVLENHLLMRLLEIPENELSPEQQNFIDGVMLDRVNWDGEN